jgi:hypothetical protein
MQTVILYAFFAFAIQQDDIPKVNQTIVTDALWCDQMSVERWNIS